MLRQRGSQRSQMGSLGVCECTHKVIMCICFLVQYWRVGTSFGFNELCCNRILCETCAAIIPCILELFCCVVFKRERPMSESGSHVFCPQHSNYRIKIFVCFCAVRECC